MCDICIKTTECGIYKKSYTTWLKKQLKPKIINNLENDGQSLGEIGQTRQSLLWSFQEGRQHQGGDDMHGTLYRYVQYSTV